ncbi:DUF1768 domain-containing protein [Favolaschia claudopus]|uniref:DUF1768 domain-containing protein n=1 Tax=Favolaschia claudopus TaxID=2862362 RepID=A0AAV9ZTB2_9AGAR
MRTKKRGCRRKERIPPYVRIRNSFDLTKSYMPQLTLAQSFARGGPLKKAEATPTPSKIEIVRKKPPEKSCLDQMALIADFDQFTLHPVTYNGVIHTLLEFQSIHSLIRLVRSFIQPLNISSRRSMVVPWHSTRPRRTNPIADTAEDAFDFAHGHKASMEEALFLKFSQYPPLQQELLLTGDSELCQDSMNDSFWGVGADLLGRNELGLALERVRENLGGAKAPIRNVKQCQNCRRKPRSGQSLYCGSSCLRADISTVPPLCPQCRRRPQIGQLRFCGETCRKLAQR